MKEIGPEGCRRKTQAKRRDQSLSKIITFPHKNPDLAFSWSNLLHQNKTIPKARGEVVIRLPAVSWKSGRGSFPWIARKGRIGRYSRGSHHPNFNTYPLGSAIASSPKAWVFLHQGGQFNIVGNYDFRNRVLSPTLGRWLTNDPLEFAAGYVNFYRYMGNGPGNGLDPSGLQDKAKQGRSWPHGVIAPSMPYYPPYVAPKEDPSPVLPVYRPPLTPEIIEHHLKWPPGFQKARGTGIDFTSCEILGKQQNKNNPSVEETIWIYNTDSGKSILWISDQKNTYDSRGYTFDGTWRIPDIKISPIRVQIPTILFEGWQQVDCNKAIPGTTIVVWYWEKGKKNVRHSAPIGQTGPNGPIILLSKNGSKPISVYWMEDLVALYGPYYSCWQKK